MIVVNFCIISVATVILCVRKLPHTLLQSRTNIIIVKRFNYSGQGTGAAMSKGHVKMEPRLTAIHEERQTARSSGPDFNHNMIEIRKLYYSTYKPPL